MYFLYWHTTKYIWCHETGDRDTRFVLINNRAKFKKLQVHVSVFQFALPGCQLLLLHLLR